jgi:hypothetical protein
LHVVQEMVDFFQSSEPMDSENFSAPEDMELMHIAADGTVDVPPAQSIVLTCQVQGHPATFLLDSGSNNSFLSDNLAKLLQGQVTLAQFHRVRVAGGGILHCTRCFPNCKWSCGNHQFCSSFKVLPLQGYDGILGMDWLSTHSSLSVGSKNG